MSLAKIGTNVQSLQALSQFNRTNNDLGARQLRLATGSRINSAADDSAGFTIAKKLESKVRGQAQALSNIGDAKGMLNVGEGTLNSVMDILQTMKEKAVQAGNATMGEDERAAIQSQMDELVKEMDDMLGGAEFNGIKLFGGSSEEGAAADAALALNFQVGAGSGDSFGVNLSKLSTSILGLTAAEAAEETEGGEEVEGGEEAEGTPASASVGGDNSDFVAEGVTFDGTENVSIDFTLDDQGNLTYVDGEDQTQTVTAEGGVYTVGGFSFSLDTEAEGFDDGGTFTLTGTAAVAGEAGEGEESEEAAGGINVMSHTGASDAIATIDEAIKTVSTTMGQIGDAQNRLSFKADNLETSRTNYAASLSGIKDADFAQESMEIAKLQILQQTGIASLAQANVSSQAVLSLIG